MLKNESYHKELILVGGGHSHIEVLRRFRMRPELGVRVTLINPYPDAQYSGMLPGLIAGHYSDEDTNLDLFKLSQACGSRFIEDKVIGLDPDEKIVLCAKRGEISFDVLSINIGSQSPTPKNLEIKHGLGVKPIQTFQNRLQDALDKITIEGRPKRIAVVGAGAAGVEVILATKHRLEGLSNETRPLSHSYFLVSSGKSILSEQSSKTRQICEKELKKNRITLVPDFLVSSFERNTASTKDGRSITADIFLWATGAVGPAWLKSSDLGITEEGFIRVKANLESENFPNIFATGDIAHVRDHLRPKSGVFAVRQGPALTANLRRALQNKPLKDFKPQKRALAMISLGEKSAIATTQFFALKGSLVWKYKNFIDKRFIKKYADLIPMSMEKSSGAGLPQSSEMRCGGCGSKIGPNLLREVLAGLPMMNSSEIIIGLKKADDAAIVKAEPGKLGVHTIDHFKQFIDDPWTLGKIAVNHALNDVFAMGASPKSALAIVGLPLSSPKLMKNDMSLLMRGASEGLAENRTVLVGGHTNEADEINIGFSAYGEVEERALIRKTGAVNGDLIIVTRPLGSGVLFAGAMKGLTKGRWISTTLQEMALSNANASNIFSECGATSLTDITGFGLVGHLSEMIQGSEEGATIFLKKLPLYDGVLALAELGIESTLKPENIKINHTATHKIKASTKYQVCFDPQTAGGLLATVSAPAADECLKKLIEAGYIKATVIGQISSVSGELRIC